MPASQPDKVLVACPHCGHPQAEPPTAFSTVCKQCHRHFRVQEILKPVRKSPTSKPSRSLTFTKQSVCRPFTVNGRITLPNARLTLVQIGIGLADLGFSSLAMYSLVPSVPGDDFITVAIACVSATLLGFASHAPGSLGVFDAAMLVALPDVGREELVAALIIYRVLYFMIPFVIALLIMAYWETTLFLASAGRRDGKPGIEKSEMTTAAKHRDR